MESEVTNGESGDSVRLLNKIPVRNVWLLFVFAFDLNYNLPIEWRDRAKFAIENSPDFKTLVARLLSFAIEKRLKRNLSLGYREREEVLRRVRGRIDMLRSVSGNLFRKGQVACCFEDLTVNTPRNRLFRAALERLASCKFEDKQSMAVAKKCRQLAHILEGIGIDGNRPTRTEISTDKIAGHEADDRIMVSLSQAVFDLVLPTEEETGSRPLFRAQYNKIKRPGHLFQKAIGNILATQLDDKDWEVYASGRRFKWPTEDGFGSLITESCLPQMETDIELVHKQEKRKIVIETKFTDILAPEHYNNRKFASKHIFQIFSYLRSRENANDILSFSTEGILLYPSIRINPNEPPVDKTVVIQGHPIRFVTIDLMLSSDDVIKQLRDIPLKKPHFVRRFQP